MKLFCFPYAGGSSLIYKDWQHKIGKDITIKAYELAGRGKKILEPIYTDIDNAACKILDDISSEIKSGKYSLFGHSMGSIIVYKLLCKIKERNLPNPSHVFLSGSKPPHIDIKDTPDHLLPEEEFIDLLKDYGKTPEEFYENQELLDFFIPKLRSDFKIANYVIEDENDIIPVDTNITVLYGDNENNLSHEEASEWEKYTTGNIKVHCIPGTHFFIDENPNPVLRIVKTTLNSLKEKICI